MVRRRYELGVKMHRRRSLLRSPTRLQAALMCAVLVAVAGLGHQGAFARLYQMGKPVATDVSHRERRPSVNKMNTYKSSTRQSNIKVRPAESVVPTATPSTVVTSTTADASVAPVTPDTAVTAQPVGADPTPATTIDPQTIPVITPSNEPGSVVITVPDLPTIIIPTSADADLDNPVKKDIAMQLVSSAENSSLDWKAQYAYLEDIGDGRGYTGGIIGFCSGTGDMLEMVQYYTKLSPNNVLAKYLPVLQKVNNTSSHTGLGAAFEADWKTAATDPLFQQAQNDERDRVYFNPSVGQAKSDGLHTLGQFIYYDAIVMHGPGSDSTSFGGIRAAAMKKAKTPAQGGDETVYLNAFLDARAAAMRTEAAHEDVDRVEKEQRLFLKAGNLDLHTPLVWSVYGDQYTIQ